MKLAFWTALCKTPGCGHRHFAKLIGKSQTEAKRLYLMKGDLPEEFHHQCGKCGTAHSYMVDDLVPFDLDLPELRGLQEWW
jgi:uncharacterized cysteine cluster protein YcgN (CxxCxxCC family)